MPKVVFFTQLDPELHLLLTQHAPDGYTVDVYATDTAVSEKSGLLNDADALILFLSRIEDEVLRSTKQLKHIQLVSAGFEHMNLDLCRELGMTISNNGGANSIDVAEQTIALILDVYRRLVDLDADVRSNRWYKMQTGKCTYTIWNKIIGLIGLGNIGRRVARLLKPFDCELIYSDATPASTEVEAALDISRCELPELLERADIVSLHVPFNDATRRRCPRISMRRITWYFAILFPAPQCIEVIAIRAIPEPLWRLLEHTRPRIKHRPPHSLPPSVPTPVRTYLRATPTLPRPRTGPLFFLSPTSMAED